MKQLPKPPKDTKLDHAIKVIQGFVGSSTFGVTDFLFDMISPINKRKEKWLELIHEAICEIQNKGLINYHELANDDEFISLFMKATRIASAEFQLEKLIMLKRTLVNSVISNINFDRKQLFLNYIETLTISHFKILNVVCRIPIPNERTDNRRIYIVNELQLSTAMEGFQFFHNDLIAKGLIDDTKQYRTPGHSIVFSPSPLAVELLNFVMDDGS